MNQRSVSRNIRLHVNQGSRRSTAAVAKAGGKEARLLRCARTLKRKSLRALRGTTLQELIEGMQAAERRQLARTGGARLRMAEIDQIVEQVVGMVRERSRRGLQARGPRKP